METFHGLHMLNLRLTLHYNWSNLYIARRIHAVASTKEKPRESGTKSPGHAKERVECRAECLACYRISWISRISIIFVNTIYTKCIEAKLLYICEVYSSDNSDINFIYLRRRK